MSDRALRTTLVDRALGFADTIVLGDKRAELLAGASGRVLDADVRAQALALAGVPDGSFDTVVCTLVLCRVDDPLAVARRLRSLLAPGGSLLFLEHVRATGAAGVAQRLAGPLWRRMSAGCHLDRNTLHTLREAGFVITDCSRSPGPLVCGRAMPRADVSGRSAVVFGADR